jgi:hypothetical protein
MDFDLGLAILAGLIGTAAMTAVMYTGYAMNMRMDMPMLLGTMFLPKGTPAFILGLTLHFMIGAIFFVIYAALFNALSIESGLAGWSAIFALVHGAVAGLAMGMMPAMHPRMATATGPLVDVVPTPGVFASSFGLMGPIAVLALHLVYGVVGALSTALKDQARENDHRRGREARGGEA